MTLLLSLLLSPSAFACSCMAPPPAPEARETSDAVVLATVAEVRSGTDAPSADEMRASHHTLVLDVIAGWKGDQGKRLEVRTATSSAACGVGLEAGQTAVVYASGDPLVTGLCTRTSTVGLRAETTALGAPSWGAVPDDLPSKPASSPPLEGVPAPEPTTPEAPADAADADEKPGCRGDRNVMLLPFLFLGLRRRP